ncbi:hypothetical protein CBM2633_P60018 [Cupriavidus taiwanensis]|uniref:Uncharacterized protein n=2 Tax=Cupriavidus TaxID=106589 RepID=A0A375CPF1_9BURK|nr:hypothetical protein CBM2588_P70019 [Cupriavidus taiwanensis]SOZ40769.1 hypothetical protein CBM2605_P60019 [Cupriavidus neocaledonicus]SOY76882.1 hypothetical protein CBM2592_P80018 [Cupriavidus taiwanensis]SOY76917.1 hypothetical protein CBM2585_P60017 [Cupriavidus taiwanensis]SOY77267.1 hypothetical protein CBM2589_P60018 [Cupriavidus taiwanensis]
MATAQRRGRPNAANAGRHPREELPLCKQGALAFRTGPYGEFRSSFPACSYKPKKPGTSPCPRIRRDQTAPEVLALMRQ